MVYSNYGYMLLGRIIEKVSGMSYESYVKQKILAPAGITRTRLGRSLKSQAASTEVPYSSKYTAKTVVDDSGATVPYPYGGFNMPNQDANGGWLASAVDLVKFAIVFDAAGPVLNATSISNCSPSPRRDHLRRFLVRLRLARPHEQRPQHLAQRLDARHVHLPGPVQHGVSYCAVFNRREEEGSPDFDAIDPILGKASGTVNTWPTTDLAPNTSDHVTPGAGTGQRPGSWESVAPVGGTSHSADWE